MASTQVESKFFRQQEKYFFTEKKEPRESDKNVNFPLPLPLLPIAFLLRTPFLIA